MTDVERCQVDLEPSQPGRYICDEPLREEYPHHDECGLHHTPGANCDDVAEMMAVDQELMRWAH